MRPFDDCVALPREALAQIGLHYPVVMTRQAHNACVGSDRSAPNRLAQLLEVCAVTLRFHGQDVSPIRFSVAVDRSAGRRPVGLLMSRSQYGRGAIEMLRLELDGSGLEG